MNALYHNKVLFLNMSTGDWRLTPLFDGSPDEGAVPEALGGPGLAMQLAMQLARHAPEASEQNAALICTTGPLTGTYAPASGGLTVSIPTRGPDAKTGWRHVHVSGCLGEALRQSGFDALVITGTASAPSLVRLVAQTCRVETLEDTGAAEQPLAQQRQLLSRESTATTALLLAGPAALAGSAHATLSTDLGAVPGGGPVAACMAAKNLVALRFDGGCSLPAPAVPLENPARAAVRPSASPEQLAATLSLLCPEWQGPLALTVGRALACRHCPSPCRFWVRAADAPLNTPWFPCTHHAGLRAALATPQPLAVLRLCDDWGLDPVTAGQAMAQRIDAAQSDLRACLAALPDAPEPVQPAPLTETECTAMTLGICPLFVRRHPEVTAALLACLNGLDVQERLNAAARLLDHAPEKRS